MCLCTLLTFAAACSNRCAALLKLNKLSKALTDAERCVALRPDWDKGYFRKGSALEAMERFEDALATYREGVVHATDNLELVEKAVKIEGHLRRTKRAEQNARNSAAAAAARNGAGAK
jgi:tetratricopeptide (TPR) repeat protein